MFLPAQTAREERKRAVESFTDVFIPSTTPTFSNPPRFLLCPKSQSPPQIFRSTTPISPPVFLFFPSDPRPNLQAMGRQTKPRKSDANVVLGKGKITPVQVAFIVDRYLASSNFLRTRSLFRSEASSFLPKASAEELPSSLLSLGEMLDEYISLKEQRVMVDQAKFHLEQENARVQTLLQGLQNLLNVYNLSAAPRCVTPPQQSSVVPFVQSKSKVSSPAGDSAFKPPVVSSVSVPDSSKTLDSANFSNPVNNSQPPRKRKIYKAISEIPGPIKRSCGATSNNRSTSSDTRAGLPQDQGATPHDNLSHSVQSLTPDGSPVVQGSSVAKTLFNESSSLSPNSNSSGPRTPKRSVSSHTDKSISPPEEISSTAKSNLTGNSMDTTPTNCTIISSKTIIVSSPAKNFSLERKRCTYYSPSKANTMTQSKRDHVKGRLDFDTTDLPVISENASLDVCTTSDSDRDADIFDFDLGALGPDFSLSELLNDFGIGCGVDYSCHDAAGASTSPLPGLIIRSLFHDEFRLHYFNDVHNTIYTNSESW
ncbi:hypothetical protein V2J09_009466 [Rumex salicifolius]